MSQNFTVNFSNPSQSTAVNVSDESVTTGCNPVGDPNNNDSNAHKGSQKGGHQHGPNCKHGHDIPYSEFDDEAALTGHGQEGYEDHGHGHSHGHGHGHGHGGRRGHSNSQRRNKMFQDHAWGIRAFTMGMPTQGAIICLFWCNEVLEQKESKFEWWLSTLFMIGSIVMCYISYIKATFCQPYAPARGVPVFADPRNNTLCKACNKWKPERSHHCSTCGKCVLKMDHHCPWIVNCVGFKNHKSFLLFCFYMAIAAVHYLWRSLVYLVWCYETGKMFEHSYLFLIWWLLVTLIIAPVCMMLTGLAFYHSALALNNTTTLDSMGGGGLQMPCVPEKFYTRGKYRYINVYDQGMISNFCNFMGNSYFLFWYPELKSVTDEGLFYSTVPTMTPFEIAQKLPQIQTQGEEFVPYIVKRPIYLSDINVEEYFQKAQEYANKKHMQFDTQILEYGKRNDNSSLTDS